MLRKPLKLILLSLPSTEKRELGNKLIIIFRIVEWVLYEIKEGLK